MSRELGDVVVVGAGLIGLAVAFDLAERGAAVRIFDRSEPAGAASWAGAGMLAPYSEGVRDEALLELCASSLHEYPAFVARILAASGIDPRLRLDGVAHAAFDPRQLDSLRRRARALQAASISCDVLDRASLLSAEPWLGTPVLGGLLVRGEGSVDNRRLGRALASACEARGARVERSSFVRVECDARRVLGVHTETGFIGAGAVVNACGAWAAALPGTPPECIPPVEPIKGQMLALEAPRGLARRPTWVPGAYVVPRDDGRLLIGATVESAGYDERVTAGGVRELLSAALAAAPSLAGLALTENWTGLRPATPDGLPILGPTPINGLFLATGHFRNGILLAPATGRLIGDALERGYVDAFEPFLLSRFGTEVPSARRITHA